MMTLQIITARSVFRESLFLALVMWSALCPVAHAQAADQQLLQRGAYLAKAGDCVSCHTAPGGKPFAGGLYMPTPFGQISTPNITADKATGIGDWSDDDFYRAMHEGIGRNKEYLYPVFPFPWFTKVTRDDALAIKAYLFSLPAEDAPRKPLQLAFPFSLRESLLAWRLAFFKPATFAPNTQHSEQMNRGAYLVEGLGHCGECHNRDKLFGASNWSGKLEGGEIEGWYAPNLTTAGGDSIAAWSEDQLVTFLKTGTAPGKGLALGPMRETIDNSLRYLSDGDLHAMAVYLKSATTEESNNAATVAAATPPTRAGADVYLSNCAYCHRPDGQGVPGMIPPLAGDPAVTAQGPENPIHVVLGGLEAAHGFAPMPAVGVGMENGDIAAVVNYIRTAWGNKAPANAGAGTVAEIRSETHTLLAGNSNGGCPAMTDPKLSALAAKASGQLAGVDMTNMLQRIDSILPELKTNVAGDDLVNALTSAYCPVVMNDSTISPAQRAALLGNFSVLVYGQTRKQGKPN
jgi:mono/diheme cytochrome c family protein